MVPFLATARVLGNVRALVLASLFLVPGQDAAQVQPLGHQTIEERIDQLGIDADDGYRFVVFGDQKNLWKKDFPQLLDEVRSVLDDGGPPVLFMLDTGDIVDDGSESHQFAQLATHLAAVQELPYLVGVGNHELRPEKGGDTPRHARQNTARFLEPPYRVDQMYFSKRVGKVRFLFLDTNDFPGVYAGLAARDSAAATRGQAQLEWLRQELEEEIHPTIVVSHHPFVQSAGKHRGHATTLWNDLHDTWDGRTLPEMLSDAGVDLVLTGHVHSYELFELARGGHTMWSVNASGKPTGSWFRRPWTRMPKDWQRRERDQMRNNGFRTRLDQWTVTQLSFMTSETKRNQFAVVIVDGRGSMQIELRAVDGDVLHALSIP